MTSKEIIEAALKENKVKLRVCVQNEDWIAIEGDNTSLEFLGNLLLAFAKESASALTLDSPELVLFEAGGDGIILYRKP